MKKALLLFALCAFSIATYAQNDAVLNAEILLQGPITSSGDSMYARLIELDSFPMQQPYRMGPWMHMGTESIQYKNNDIVDWILVELRNAEDMTMMESRRAGLLMANGSIVDTSLQNPLRFHELDSGLYYVVIRHRNHLPVMTANPIMLAPSAYHDFSDTNAVKLWGGNNKALIQTSQGKWSMIAGDVNNDMRVQYSGAGNDRSMVIQDILLNTGSTSITTTTSGYRNADINMDSVVKYAGVNNDPSKIIQSLINLTGSTSITSIHENYIPETFMCGMHFIDPRDGHVYMSMPIGEMCWMTENLKLGSFLPSGSTPTDNDTLEKYCYNDDTLNCDMYGGLYTWDEMMKYSDDEYNQGICPYGWHLPTDEDWYELESFIDPMIDDPNATGWRGAMGGMELQSGAGSGFEAFLGGYRDASGNYSGEGMEAKFWTSSKLQQNMALHRGISMMNPGILRQGLDKNHALSVRCVRGEPVGIKPDIVLMDSANVILLPDTAQMNQGIFHYQYLGQDSLDIEPGDIIIGGFPYPYLRRVIQIDRFNNEYVILTEQATLEDVFDNADFQTTLLLDDSTSTLTKVYVNRHIDYLAKGVSLSDEKGQLKYDFSDVVLYQSGPFTFKIDTGYFLLDPAFHFEFKYKKGAVRKLAFYTDNALLEHQIDLGVHVSAAYTLSDYHKTLATYGYDIVFFIGWLPVYIELKADLVGISKASFDAAFDATYGYKDQKYLTAGMIYEHGGWRKIYDYQNNYTAHPLDWSGEVHFRQYAALAPKFSVKLYSVAGPYIEAIGYDSLLANVVLPAMNWDAILKLGFNSKLGAEVEIFGKNLADYHKEIFAFETTLWEAPYSLSKISGDGQIAMAGNPLNNPIKVKVVDNLNNSWLPVPVRFRVKSGGGSVSDTVVYSDANGFAQTNWTLGNEIGTQELEVLVMRADLSNIGGSPLSFTARAWYTGAGNQPCPGLPSITWVGQEYGTVQIGDRCWLNANLNTGTFLNSSQSLPSTGGFEKYCYDNDVNNCLIYGGLYTWEEAMQSDTTEEAQGICPPGWQIPSDNDWKVLEGEVDSLYGPGDAIWNSFGFRGSNAGRLMRSVSGWSGSKGDSSRVFNALPGGKLTSAFSGSGQSAWFWSSNSHSAGQAISRNLLNNDDRSNREAVNTGEALSVRCIMDTACYPPPDQADAGADQDSVPGGYLNLSGNVPTNGAGYWNIIQGNGGVLSDPASPYSSFSGGYDSTYLLSWTISTYCGSTSDTVLIHFDSYVFGCGDSITDSRNGKRYSTVPIGNHCWMGENLNIGTKVFGPQNQNNNGTIEKYCINDLEFNCDSWGAFYQWGEAMQYSTTENTQGVCPDGWYIPCDTIWYNLEGTIDSYYGPDNSVWLGTFWRGSDAGYKMKSTSGWTGTGANGSNSSGFNALPAGYRVHNSPSYPFATTGLAAHFWTSSSIYSQGTNQGYHRSLGSTYDKIRREYASPMGHGFSIRCVRDLGFGY